MNIDNIDPKEVGEAVAKSFIKEQVHPNLTLAGLRKTLAMIPEEYDECVVNFSFLLKDCGDSGNNDGMKNFILGTIPIKRVTRHPDETKILMCDEASTEYFVTFCKSSKTDVTP
jgi:hypothetical protein